jgi:pyruvate ferredoxin oxidoreductase delta subunit
MKYKNIPIGLASGVRPQMHTGDWRSFRPVVDMEKCTRCGLCVIYCPEACIVMDDEGLKFDYDYCKGCGICDNECNVDAISMEREELAE